MLNFKREKTVLELLEESSFQFYLAGSKYFGHAVADSDTDLMCEYSPEAVEFLLTIGFHLNSIGNYFQLDVNCIMVMSYGEGCNKIDIQLAKDIDCRIEAHKLAKERKIPWLYIAKENRHRIWNSIFQELAEKKGEQNNV